eukprot:1564622-Lingulodinium_polyedra.AAC.1
MQCNAKQCNAIGCSAHASANAHAHAHEHAKCSAMCSVQCAMCNVHSHAMQCARHANSMQIQYVPNATRY